MRLIVCHPLAEAVAVSAEVAVLVRLRIKCPLGSRGGAFRWLWQTWDRTGDK